MAKRTKMKFVAQEGERPKWNKLLLHVGHHPHPHPHYHYQTRQRQRQGHQRQKYSKGDNINDNK